MAAPPSAPPQIVFSREVPNLNDWATRTGIPLTTADALGKTYARAHPRLLRLKAQLLQQYGWREASPADSRILIDIECTSPIRSHGGAPRMPAPAL